jgi:hypothetical protein
MKSPRHSLLQQTVVVGHRMMDFPQALGMHDLHLESRQVGASSHSVQS